MNSKIRLGIIGLSDENGHPYSWSAIFNGYNPEAMKDSGFPLIVEYLSRQRFPDDAISDAHVTHVWAQRRDVAEHIATACRIPFVVDDLTDLIGNVDGILLARDDAETHYYFSKPFIEAGLPIYIDKPIALSVADAKRIYALERYPGQIFTCSPLRYARELQVTKEDRAAIGVIQHVHAVVPKDWARYSTHIIEPILEIIGLQGTIARSGVWREGDATTVCVAWETGLQATMSALGDTVCPIAIRVMGTRGYRDLTFSFSDTFSAFKATLLDFVSGVRRRDIRSHQDFILEAVRIVEIGIANE